MHKFKIALLLVLVISFTVSCNNEKPSESALDNNTQLNEKNSKSTVKKDTIETESNNKNFYNKNINLFPTNKTFNKYDEIKLNINNEEVESHFVINKYTEFGLYIPDIIQIKDFEDGNEFYLDDGEFITLIAHEVANESDFDNSMLKAEKFINDFGPTSEVSKIEELKKYTEYLGSKINEYDKEEDFFLFKYKDKNLIIILTYNKENRNTTLPIFLEIIKTVKYITDK